MVDIIDFAFTVTDIDELLHDINDVFVAQRTRAFDLVAQQRTVKLHATHGRQIIAVS